MSEGSIDAAGRRCAQAFVQAVSLLANRPSQGFQGVDSQIKDQLSRFKIWAGNIGVFADGRLSADFRLRDHKEVRDVILRMLERLVERLESFESAEPDDADGRSEESTSDTDRSSGTSVDLSDDTDEEIDGLDAEIAGPVKRVEEIVTNLYRITAVIKKPVSSREDDLVQAWSSKNVADLHDELDGLRSYLNWWTQRQFPGVSTAIRSRIIETSVRRRQRLLYRKAHCVALQGRVNDWFVPRRTESIISPAPRMDRPDPVTTADQRAPVVEIRESKSICYGDDQASSVPTHGFSQRAKSVVLSEISPSVRQNLGDLDVPPPPRQESGSPDVICPYCNLPLRKEIQSERLGLHWRRHVLQDIDPYICLFDQCDDPKRSYRTKEDWVSHMARQHTTIWSCQTKSHAHDLFMTKEDLASHFRREHGHDIPEEHIPLMLERGKKPMPDPFAVLATRLGSYACPFTGPFCAEKVDAFHPTPSSHVPEFPEAAYKRVRDHIAGHLESIALLSLPNRDDVESQGSSDRVLDDRRPLDRADADIPSDLDFDEYPHRNDEWSKLADPVDWSSIFDGLGGRYVSFPPADQDEILQQFKARRPSTPPPPGPNFWIAPNASYDVITSEVVEVPDELQHALNDSREEVMASLRRWAGDPNGKYVAYLTGEAGRGKSTVCRSFATQMDRQGWLAASFFFKSDDIDRCHVDYLFPTMAYQMAVKSPPFRDALAEVVERGTRQPVAWVLMDHQDGMYRCSHPSCEDLRSFVYQAGLLRHERETHNMHGGPRRVGFTQLAEAEVPGTENHKSLEKIQEMIQRIANMSMREQFDTLILQPSILVLRSHEPLDDLQHVILVIDGLDECTDKHDIEEFCDFLQLACQHLVPAMAFLVSGRPSIVSRVSRGSEVFRVDSSEAFTEYLEHRFAVVRLESETSDSTKILSPTWPGFGLAEVLTRTSIYSPDDAVIIADIISRSYDALEEEFRVMFGRIGMDLSDLSISTRSIDNFYASLTPCLTWPMRSSYDLKTALASIAVLRQPLSVHVVAELYEKAPLAIILAIRRLSAVIDVPSDPNGLVQIRHKSFRRYTLERGLAVASKIHHKRLAEISLLLMSRIFKRDEPLLTGKPGMPRDEVSARAVRETLSDATVYACQYWIYHALEAFGSNGLPITVYDFLRAHFLPWFEALLWLGCDTASVSIQLTMLMKASEDQLELKSFLQDAYRLVRMSHPTIVGTPLQVYYSALFYMPFRSVIREGAYASACKASLLATLTPTWRSKSLGEDLDAISCVTISRDGHYVVSGSTDGKVRVWSTDTGLNVRTLIGHRSTISSVTISLDGQKVASRSDGETIRLWSVARGEEITRLRAVLIDSALPGDTSPPVLFAGDDRYVVSAEADNSITLWYVTTGEEARRLTGHTARIKTLAVSSDGQKIASTSGDGEVKLWDVVTGEKMNSWVAQDEPYSALAFQPDGHILALGSAYGTVELRRVTDFSLRMKLKTNPVRAIAFAEDCQTLISAETGGDLVQWDLDTGARKNVITGHDEEISCMSLTGDGRLMASSSRDGSMRLWSSMIPSDEDAVRSLARRWHRKVTSLMFSENGRWLMSTSDEQAVRLWDSISGRVVVEVHTRDTVESFGRIWKDSVKVRLSKSTLLLEPPSEDGAVFDGPETISLEEYIVDVVDGWVRYLGEDTLRLPPQYDGGSWAVRGNLLAIADNAGSIAVIRFDPGHSSG